MTKKSVGRLQRDDNRSKEEQQQEINNLYSLTVAKLGDAQYRKDKLTKEISAYAKQIDELYIRAQELNPPVPPVTELKVSEPEQSESTEG